MNYIVFDLEATCWQPNPDKNQMEIIEIGAVKVNEQGKIIDEFCEIIKPEIHPQLSDFCTELTTITQDMVNMGISFPEAYDKFRKWIGEDYYLCSWGYYDKKQLTMDCTYHNLPVDWLEQHISVKHQYSTMHGVKKMGIKGALAREELTFEGVHHRGIDDAYNISKIFIKYLDNYKKIINAQEKNRY